MAEHSPLRSISPAARQQASQADLDLLIEMAAVLPREVLMAELAKLPPQTAQEMLAKLGPEKARLPKSPIDQAFDLDPNYQVRPHLAYLSQRITKALADVERGQSRKLIVEMPPRSGKTTMATIFAPVWALRQHPDWPVALASHDGTLATSWGRQIRRYIEQNDLGLAIARDAGAASEWETTQGGKVLSVSRGESFTGRGAKFLVIDDPHKDFADAHSPKSRQNVWDWWLSVALLRQNPPTLIVVIMTRWHEDDLVGRLLSHDHEGRPEDWEVINLPAIATDHDVLGRSPGDPLYSPLIEETREQALARWEELRTSVGSYVWAALMQQSPAPAQGDIFNTEWWRFWTTDPAKATDDGKIIHLDPARDLGQHARWLDSWDCAFKGKEDSDYVVGQRWARETRSSRRFLIAQLRGRWSFTQTLQQMKGWSGGGPYGDLVHERLVEDKANGTAVIDTLKDQVSGMIPINPTDSKAARARSITPEVEAGNVYLPLPSDPGNEWVQDLLSELREFDHGTHDDQVDALSQALRRLRDQGRGGMSVPGRTGRRIDRHTAQAASSMRSLTRNGSRRLPNR